MLGGEERAREREGERKRHGLWALLSDCAGRASKMEGMDVNDYIIIGKESQQWMDWLCCCVWSIERHCFLST